MDISIIIPIFNEEESLPELERWIGSVMNNHNFAHEIIMVDDGSIDKSWEVVESLALKNPNVRGIKFRRNFGKAAALHTGFQAAKGDVVVTMDADLQDSPDEIPEMYNMIKKDRFDLISGWKKKRYDPLSKRIPSKFYNKVVKVSSGIELHDFNCGLKAYRKEVIKSIEVYGEMHRYIPVLAKKAGFAKIGEKVVQHRKRQFGQTKFGVERFINGYLDLMSILFISKFGKRPMHFFGLLGTLVFILGLFAALFLGAQKLYYLYYKVPARLVADSPYFYLALTAMIIGTQLFLAGFLGELVSRNATDRNKYDVEKEI